MGSVEIWAHLWPGLSQETGEATAQWAGVKEEWERLCEMSSTPCTGSWAGRCCCFQGHDAQSPGWTALWIWLSKSIWVWCELFTTLCQKISASGLHMSNYSLPQSRKSPVNDQPLKGMSHREEYVTCLVDSCSQQLSGESLPGVPKGKKQTGTYKLAGLTPAVSELLEPIWTKKN